MENALPIPYFHVVFTVPDSPFCFVPGFTSVLHTWSQTLQFHPHIHVMIPAVGLSKDGVRFIRRNGKFFLPVRVLSVVFRAIFLG